MKWTVEDNSLDLALQAAVLEKNKGKVREVLKKCVNKKGYLIDSFARALGYACRYAGVEITEMLLEEGLWFYYSDTPEERAVNAITDGDLYSRIVEPCLYFMRTDLPLWHASNDLIQMDQQCKRLSRKEQGEVLNLFAHVRFGTYFEPEELLFFSIVYDDRDVQKLLAENDVTSISWFPDCLRYADNRDLGVDEYRDASYAAILKVIFEAENRAELMRRLWAANDRRALRLPSESGVARVAQKFGFEIPQNWDSETYTLLLRYTHYFIWKRGREFTEEMHQFIRRNMKEPLSYVLRRGFGLSWRKFEELADYAREIHAPEEILNDIIEARDASGKRPPHAPTALQTQDQIWSYDRHGYGDEKKTAYIKSFKGHLTTTDVVVPEYIGDYLVTGIQADAFAVSRGRFEQIREARRSMTSLALPGSIATIPEGFLKEQPEVRKISLGEGMKEIQKDAFCECPELTEVELPKSLKTIGEGAFRGCAKLREVCGLAKSVKIGKDAFSGCPELRLDV